MRHGKVAAEHSVMLCLSSKYYLMTVTAFMCETGTAPDFVCPYTCVETDVRLRLAPPRACSECIRPGYRPRRPFNIEIV